ncbi:FAD binding domain-containing protein [Ruegeria sp. 2205SS24-7]|uniref:FAD binding domain-containing protein n=1 Tax=Ruegeria discodermiae TaxID=3064389 RepID=UPI002742409E|nr:FAD binding domain-containing protein [Ruegeria sp. 2205SS24-7]MDP5218888.1 FAD binding domain-containing protein [Ruegeria sp. 2205SS24-7]
MSITVETYATLAEATSAMRDKTQFLGGGTMVVRGINYGAQDYNRVVRSTDAALRGIRNEGNQISIGAGVTMSQIMASSSTDFLAPVARLVGGPAIRNMATAGGNLFVRPPYGDFGTALLALDANVQMSDGQSLPIERFYAQRDSQRGIVAAILLPRPAHGVFRFRKVTRTKPKGASVLSIAATLPGGSRITEARIAFGAMGPTPLRAKEAEQALEGASLDATGIQRALDTCLNGLDPSDDSLASGWYRRAVAPVHLRRLLLGKES